MLVLALDTSTDAVVVGLADFPTDADDPGDRTRVLAEQSHPGARRHGEQLMPAVLEVCAAAGVGTVDIGAVVCGVGPGPFTGLRVGIASASALADALGVPAHGVCSLDAIAASVEPGEPLLVITDARRREVYWATYDATTRDATARDATARDATTRDATTYDATTYDATTCDAATQDAATHAATGARRTNGPAVDTPAALAARVAELGVRRVAGTMAETHAELLGLTVHPARTPTVTGLLAVAAGTLRSGTLRSDTLRSGDRPGPLEPLYLRRPDAVPPTTRKRVTAG